jgi:WD40 repeat protein
LVGAAFGADGRFVLTWDGRTARVWRQRPDAERRVYTLVHRASLLAATLTANEDEIVTLTRDGVVHRWNKDQEAEPQLALPRKLVGATFDAKGERIAGWTGDHTVGIFNARNAHDLVGPMRHDASDLGIRGIAFNGDGSRVMSFGDDKTARIWDSASGKLLATLSHPAGVNGMTPSRDDAQVLTWSADNTVRLWNVADQRIAAKLPAFDYGVVGATMTSDKSRIITWDENGGIRVYNASDGTLQKTLAEGTGIAVKGVVFSADERRLLIFDERSIRIQDADDKMSRASVAWDSGEANRAVFTRDATRVLSWGGAGARLWEARTGQSLTSWLARKGTITGARLSDDERTLIVWTDAVVRSFDVGVDDVPDPRAYALAQQIRTGTRLSPMGRVEVIPASEWRGLGPVTTAARNPSEARATARP